MGGRSDLRDRDRWGVVVDVGEGTAEHRRVRVIPLGTPVVGERGVREGGQHTGCQVLRGGGRHQRLVGDGRVGKDVITQIVDGVVQLPCGRRGVRPVPCHLTDSSPCGPVEPATWASSAGSSMVMV